MEDERNFFDLNVRILKWSGLWIPSRNRRGYKRALAYDSILVSYSILFFTLAEFLALRESSQNLDDLIKNLNMSLSFLLTCFKVTTWFYHRKSILCIMDRLSKDASLFEKIDDFDPPSIIRREENVKNSLTVCFLTLACLVPTSAGLASFRQIWTAASTNGTAGLHSIKLPYYSWVPFDYKSSAYLFATAVVYQCFALLSCGTMTVGLDMNYMALVSFTSAHFKISQGAFRSIRKTCLKRLNLRKEFPGKNRGGSLDDEMQKEIGKCIRHLQSLFVYGISKMLENDL